MTEPLPDERRKAVPLPPRVMAEVGSCSRTGPPRRSVFALCVRKCFEAGSFLIQGLLRSCRKAEPWMFLMGAAVCIILTFLLRIVSSSFATRPEVTITQTIDTASDTPADAAGQRVLPPIEAPEERPRAQPSKREVQRERQTRFRLLPAEELEALNARPRVTEGGPVVAVSERPNRQPRQDSLPDAQFALGAQNPNRGGPGEERQDFAQDPVTGAWFSKSNIWEVRDKYWLPIDGNEITRGRFNLGTIGVKPLIEMQWWFPRSVEVPEKHYKGKIAKLRFLAVLAPAQIKLAENHVRIVHTLGCTADGFALVEAEAIFFSPAWNLVSTAVEEKPEWFADDEMSLKKGGTGHLPVKGHDIDLVRKALLREEPGARIREVKWWPPRLNRADHHRLSKLRYEVSRNGVVRIEEIVFDHIDSKVSYAHLADGLFPEFDRRTTKLEPAVTR